MELPATPANIILQFNDHDVPPWLQSDPVLYWQSWSIIFNTLCSYLMLNTSFVSAQPYVCSSYQWSPAQISIQITLPMVLILSTPSWFKLILCHPTPAWSSLLDQMAANHMQPSNLKARAARNGSMQTDLQHANHYGHSVEELDVQSPMWGPREYNLNKFRKLAALIWRGQSQATALVF